MLTQRVLEAKKRFGLPMLDYTVTADRFRKRRSHKMIGDSGRDARAQAHALVVRFAWKAVWIR